MTYVLQILREKHMVEGSTVGKRIASYILEGIRKINNFERRAFTESLKTYFLQCLRKGNTPERSTTHKSVVRNFRHTTVFSKNDFIYSYAVGILLRRYR